MSIENSVRLIGHLGDEPKVSYTQAGTAVARMNIATTRKFKDKDGNKQEDTSWHRVVAFGKTGELAGEYLHKGSKVAIEGRMQYGSYEKDGVKHYTADVVVEQMTFLSPAKEGDNTERQTPRRQGGDNTVQRQREAAGEPPPMDDFTDDDLRNF